MFHLIETTGVTQENCEVKPCASSRVAGSDRRAILALGAGRILVFFGQAGRDPVRHRWIQRHNGIGLRLSFVFAAADHTGSLNVELREIGAGLPALWVELHGALERHSNFLGQACRGEKSNTVRFFSVNAAEPKMIEAFLRIEISGAFTRCDAAVPLVDHEVGAAEQVLGLGVRGGAGDLLLKNLDRFIRAARSKQSPGGLQQGAVAGLQRENEK